MHHRAHRGTGGFALGCGNRTVMVRIGTVEVLHGSGHEFRLADRAIAVGVGHFRHHAHHVPAAHATVAHAAFITHSAVTYATLAHAAVPGHEFRAGDLAIVIGIEPVEHRAHARLAVGSIELAVLVD